MTSRTIRIAPLPQHTTQQTIRNSLENVSISRIYVGKGEAYVQMQNDDSMEVLESAFTDNKIQHLGGAIIDKVGPSFKWDSLSSDSSSIQDLKEQREHFDKNQDHVTHLTEPSPQNLVTISYCDFEIVQHMTQNQIKTKVFPSFSTINRVLKKGSKVIIELQMAESELLQAKFPNLKVPTLGNSAMIDLDAESTPNFSMQWIEQHKLQQTASQKKKIQQQNFKNLHEQLFPKLISVQSDVSLPHQSFETHFTDFHEYHSDKISDNNNGFIIGEQLKAQNQQNFVLQNTQKEEMRKKTQEKKLEQQIRKLKQQQEKKQQKVEKQQSQKQHIKPKLGEQKHEKQPIEPIGLLIEKQDFQRKTLQQQIRIQKQTEQAQRKTRQRFSDQFILTSNVINSNQNTQNLINSAKTSTFTNLVMQKLETPVAFWAIVLVSILVLLLI